MSISRQSFGKTKDGREVSLFVLENKNGVRAEVTDFGAILVRLFVPDQNGEKKDIVLGFDNVAGYEKNGSFFGATIGPSANRIANASFTIDGVDYQVDVNDGVNNLHSHMEDGYHKMIWEAKEGENEVTFTVKDSDGYMGFPGNKVLSLTYSLDDENRLTLHYHGKSDKNTILNPTNHTYFNLEGHNNGIIEDHELQLNCSCYTPVVAGAIPTGEIAPVKGTVMDFTSPKVVGKEIRENFEQLLLTKGYDHNWVVDDANGELKKIATVKAPKSGIIMDTYTTLPGVQFYAGNCIGAEEGKTGAQYDVRSGLCLETQYYPDTIHHANFPSCVFGPEREYDSVTIYQFR